MSNNSFKKKALPLVLIVLIIIGLRYFQEDEKGSEDSTAIESKQTNDNSIEFDDSADIDQLTDERAVIAYIKENNKLPDFYMTKEEARAQGWQPQKGNLCEVLPGKAIGGDQFHNREGKLPTQQGRIYYEADVNYNCGRRGAERIVFSKDGLIFISKDHYKSFEKP